MPRVKSQQVYLWGEIQYVTLPLVWFLTPGWIYDWMHSYDLAFYFSGSFVLLGGAGLFLSALSCWNKNQDETNTPDTEYTNDYNKVATVA